MGSICEKHLNLILTGYSYLRSLVTRIPEVKGMPVSIGIELTNNCNLNCPECITGSGQMKRERGYMKLELFDKILKELSPYLYNANLFFQGEPMLHPLFFSFLESCADIHTTVSTNGHFLSEQNAEKLVKSGLNHLIISLDGIDQEVYSAYRKNGNVNAVKDGIKYVVKAKTLYKSKIRIEIQFLVSKFNEHQIPQIKRLAKDLKVNLKLKSMQILGKKNILSWLPSESRFRRYEIRNGEFELKSNLPDRCARLWFNPVITWDGKILPCCFDKNGEHILGELTQDTFRDIWTGPKYRIFMKSVLSGRHMIEICRNCTSGLTGADF